MCSRLWLPDPQGEGPLRQRLDLDLCSCPSSQGNQFQGFPQSFAICSYSICGLFFSHFSLKGGTGMWDLIPAPSEAHDCWVFTVLLLARAEYWLKVDQDTCSHDTDCHSLWQFQAGNVPYHVYGNIQMLTLCFVWLPKTSIRKMVHRKW